MAHSLQNGQQMRLVIIGQQQLSIKSDEGGARMTNLVCLSGKLDFREYNILLPVEIIKKMSYLTMLPNAYYNSSNQMSQLANQYLLNQNQINAQNILSYLKTALSISVNNYQLNYQPNATFTPSSSQEVKKVAASASIPTVTVEILQSHEENMEISQSHAKDEIKIVELKEMVVQEKENKKEPVTLTDDEFLADDRQKNAKKSLLSKKKVKKIKQAPACDFVVPIPQVTLIETACLPLFSLERDELAQKRVELLMRKVGDWSEFCKGKKDKREIRMLSN